MLSVGDYRRSVFNAATISRTTTMMIKALSGQKRSNCNGNGQLGTHGKCICNQGYVSSDCKWTSAQFETIQSLISDFLNHFINLNQVKLQSIGESISRDYLTNLLFGIDSLLQNYEYFNTQLFNSSLIILKESMDSVQSSSLTLESGEVTYLKGILNYLYKVVSQSQECWIG